MSKLRLVLADDHTVMRQGLCLLLNAEKDLTVVGEAGTGAQAVELTRRLLPDVVVMDLVLPDFDGVEATRRILQAIPDTKVIVLSAHGDEERVRASIEAGVTGYLLKCAGAEDLLLAIRESHKGNAFFSPCVTRQLSEYCRRNARADFLHPRPGAVLTSREVEVLGLIAQGKLNKQIAAQLAISIKTVESHRQKVMDKLNIHAIAGLTRYAIAKGLVQTE